MRYFNLGLALLLTPVLLAGCQPKPAPGWSGYVEGDYVYVASALGGTLTQLNVRAGDQAVKDAPVFALESDNEQAARQKAEARLAASELAREEQLVTQGFVSAAHRDEFRVAQLPARLDERVAALADTEAARQCQSAIFCV
jgi:HlyD family secretion protein